MEPPSRSYLGSWIHLLVGAMVVLSVITLYGYVTHNAPLPLQLITYVNVAGWLTITGGVITHWLRVDFPRAWETGEIDYAVGDLAMILGMTILACVLVMLVDGD